MRLANLANSFANSATFRKLVAAGSPTDALASIIVDLVGDFDLDAEDENTPFPRCVVRHIGPQVSKREGTTTYLAVGQMAVYVQYLQFTDAQLATWYSLSGPFTDVDRRQHMNNLFGQICDDVRALATTAGCLEFQTIEEFSCGYADPIEENGLRLVELTYVVHREGSP